MWLTLRQTLLLRSTLAVLLALLAGATAGGTVAYWARDAEVDRVDRRLEAFTVEVIDSGRVIARLTSEAGDLRVEGERQSATIRELETSLADTAARLDRAETAQGELGLTYVDLLDARDVLQSAFETLEAEREELMAQIAIWSTMTRIDSARLPIDPLLFDPASGAAMIRAVCTGSMEPAISCDDTLIAFTPSTQDLDVGDIIIFRAPEPGCAGFSFTSTILHRIVAVQRSAEGQIQFETKGDVLADPDPCPVPATHVLFEVLAIISDSRFDQ
ncbi:MAG: hypothetical protein V3S31_05975 [Dehalococcoidia bacterium]